MHRLVAIPTAMSKYSNIVYIQVYCQDCGSGQYMSTNLPRECKTENEA